MQAVRLHQYGGPATLRYETAPEPQRRTGWVTVALRAAALNWHDRLVRQGRYPTTLPLIPGADGAGIVRETGEQVVVLPSLWWGDREDAPDEPFEILGDRIDGTYAELVVVPAENVLPKPAALSWTEAAAVPLAGLTAHRALFARGRLRANERVLVLGAGGGVAGFVIAFASACGARVTVTSSSTEGIDAALGLGAAAGVLYHDPDWPDHARAVNDDRGFDLVIDPVGQWASAAKALRPGGRLVTFGANASEQAQMDVRRFYFGQFSLLGTTMGSPRDFAAMLDLVARMPGWRPSIGAVLPLDRAADAHSLLERAETRGKIVLEIA